MTNDIGATGIAAGYAPANYRSADVFGGNYPIQTPAGKKYAIHLRSYLIANAPINLRRSNPLQCRERFSAAATTT